MQSKSNSIEDHNLMVKVTIPVRWAFDDTILFDKLESLDMTEFISCKGIQADDYLDGPTLRLVDAGSWLEKYTESHEVQDIVIEALRHCLIGANNLRIPVSWIGRIDPIKLFTIT